MKLLVCISKAPDTTSKIAFTDGDTKFDENGVQYIVNPYDEWYALVRALELTEANGGTVTTITVGTPADDPTIRKALAIGATDAVRVDAEAKDPYFVAKQIAAYAKACWEKWLSDEFFVTAFTDTVISMDKAKHAWRAAKGPFAATLLSARRIKWNFISAYTATNDQGTLIDMKTDSPQL